LYPQDIPGARPWSPSRSPPSVSALTRHWQTADGFLIEPDSRLCRQPWPKPKNYPEIV